MEKTDLKKELKNLYCPPSKEVVAVDVPQMRFLMTDGEGDPNTSPSFQQSVEALFSVSYTAKFMVKKGPQQIDYAVMPVEALWWADDMAAYTSGDKSRWKWTMMIMQPDFVSEELLRSAIDEARRKKNLPGIDQLRIEMFHEGRCAQIMHIGPFANEGPTVKRLHDYIDASGSKRTGKHHEIYLSDIRRAAPEKWKTILRQPVG